MDINVLVFSCFCFLVVFFSPLSTTFISPRVIFVLKEYVSFLNLVFVYNFGKVMFLNGCHKKDCFL